MPSVTRYLDSTNNPAGRPARCSSTWHVTASVISTEIKLERLYDWDVDNDNPTRIERSVTLTLLQAGTDNPPRQHRLGGLAHLSNYNHQVDLMV